MYIFSYKDLWHLNREVTEEAAYRHKTIDPKITGHFFEAEYSTGIFCKIVEAPLDLLSWLVPCQKPSAASDSEHYSFKTQMQGRN